MRVLSLVLALTLFPTVAWSQEAFYRVEVLVFRHLSDSPGPNPIAGPLQFDQARAVTGDSPAPGMWTLSEPGEEFARIRNQMRRSAGYRPLAWLGWIQNTDRSHPALRITEDPVVVLVADEDACPGLLEPVTESALTDEPAPLGVTESGRSFPLPRLDRCRPGHAARRLDGSVRLRLRRFLHLELDLAWHQIGVPTAPPSLAEPTDRALVVAASGPRWLAWRLDQSRQVRSEQLEYFDTPYFGVLARVTPATPEEVQALVDNR